MELQRAAITLVNEAHPDVVLLTGDFVCHSELFLEDLSFLLGQIAAPSFAVLGNHDHWTNAQSVKKALQKAGVEVLENAHTVVDIRHQKLQLVGLDDPYTQHDDVAKATRGLKKDIFTVGLSHIAEKAEDLWPQGVDLVLSGHTHAGQVTVARLNELVLGKLGGHKYIHGLYHKDKNPVHKQSVYVGAGVGSAIIPFRFGEKAKREVTIFEIQPSR
jgi:predicted MPP superfamily phosphohydrolase